MLVCELKCQRGEYQVEVTTILHATRTEEGRPEAAIGEGPSCDRLRDGGLSRPGESVEPENRGSVQIFNPALDLCQYTLSCSLQATGPIPVFISCTDSMRTAVQYRCVIFKRRKPVISSNQSKDPDLDPV